METKAPKKSLDHFFGERSAEDKFWDGVIEKIIRIIEDDSIPDYEDFLKNQ